MKVIVAKTAGFCWGVRRAMDAVLDASARGEGRVQTLGPLIHNPQALELIGKRGVEVAADPEGVKDGTVVIRAHGIPIQDLRGLRERAKEGSLEIVNATCPEVAKVHSRIKKWSPKGYFTVILGIHGHAESLAHRSFAASGSTIVASMEEAKALTDEQVKRLLIVAQTTFTVKDFNEIADYLRGRSEDCIVENTICEDTWTRQEEAHRIATAVDAVVVVGGKNSANTRHLVELAEHHGRPVQYVETAAELDLSRLPGHATVGVLAGASTPTWLVEEVVDTLEHHGAGAGLSGRALQEVVARPAILALGAAATTVGMSAWLGLVLRWQEPVMAAGYVLAMFLLTPYLDPLGVGSKGPANARFLRSHRWGLVATGLGALCIALTLAGMAGTMQALVLAGASVLGALYKLRIPLGGTRFSLRSIPGSKDIVVALAMSVVLVGLPVLTGHGANGFRVFAALFFVGAQGFARTGIQNLLDMQKDRIMGRETLPILLGRKAAKWVMGFILALGFGLMAVAGPLKPLALVLLAAASAWPLAHMYLFHERFSTGRRTFEPPLEASMLLLALLAFL